MTPMVRIASRPTIVQDVWCCGKAVKGGVNRVADSDAVR